MSKAFRSRKIEVLKRCSKNMKTLFESPSAPTTRLLTQNVENLQTSLNEAQEAQCLFMADERADDEEKNEADSEWDLIFLDVSRTLDKGEENLETLTAASRAPVISSSDRQAINLDRVKHCMERFNQRAKGIVSSLDGLAIPNAGQLNIHRDLVENLRKEVTVSLDSSFCPLYEFMYCNYCRQRRKPKLVWKIT